MIDRPRLPELSAAGFSEFLVVGSPSNPPTQQRGFHSLVRLGDIQKRKTSDQYLDRRTVISHSQFSRLRGYESPIIESSIAHQHHLEILQLTASNDML